MSKAPEGDLAYRILRLECSLDAYRRLHTEELDELERQLEELKSRVLVPRRTQEMEPETEVKHEMNATTDEFPNKG